jgi:hypothetical protein
MSTLNHLRPEKMGTASGRARSQETSRKAHGAAQIGSLYNQCLVRISLLGNFNSCTEALPWGNGFVRAVMRFERRLLTCMNEPIVRRSSGDHYNA